MRITIETIGQTHILVKQFDLDGSLRYTKICHTLEEVKEVLDNVFHFPFGCL
jgi:hypothetical protein